MASSPDDGHAAARSPARSDGYRNHGRGAAEPGASRRRAPRLSGARGPQRSDARLQDKIAELEEIPPAPHPARQYSATETGGRSARDFFRAMLATRPPHAAPGVAGRSRRTKPGSPGRARARQPGRRTIRCPSARSSGKTAHQRDRPCQRPATPRRAVSRTTTFSTPRPGEIARPPRAPDSKSDDLDQFHTWLQNLKR